MKKKTRDIDEPAETDKNASERTSERANGGTNEASFAAEADERRIHPRRGVL